MGTGSRTDAHLPLTDLAVHVLVAVGPGPIHGYAIGKRVEELSGGRLRPTTGSLYQVLRRLTESELLVRVEVEEEVDGRRQYLELTSLGRRVLKAEAARLTDLASEARAAIGVH